VSRRLADNGSTIQRQVLTLLSDNVVLFRTCKPDENNYKMIRQFW